jgi:hypothetical protein
MEKIKIGTAPFLMHWGITFVVFPKEQLDICRCCLKILYLVIHSYQHQDCIVASYVTLHCSLFRRLLFNPQIMHSHSFAVTSDRSKQRPSISISQFVKTRYPPPRKYGGPLGTIYEEIYWMFRQVSFWLRYDWQSKQKSFHYLA